MVKCRQRASIQLKLKACTDLITVTRELLMILFLLPNHRWYSWNSPTVTSAEKFIFTGSRSEEGISKQEHQETSKLRPLFRLAASLLAAEQLSSVLFSMRCFKPSPSGRTSDYPIVRPRAAATTRPVRSQHGRFLRGNLSFEQQVRSDVVLLKLSLSDAYAEREGCEALETSLSAFLSNLRLHSFHTEIGVTKHSTPVAIFMWNASLFV